MANNMQTCLCYLHYLPHVVLLTLLATNITTISMCVQPEALNLDRHPKAELYVQLLLLVGWAMYTRSVKSSQQLPAAQPQRKRRGKVGLSTCQDRSCFRVADSFACKHRL